MKKASLSLKMAVPSRGWPVERVSNKTHSRLLATVRFSSLPVFLTLLLPATAWTQVLKTSDVSPDFPFGTVAPSCGNTPQCLDGRVDGVVVDPHNDQILYAVGEDSGVWKSTDGAHTWKQSSNGLRNGRTLEFAYPNLAIDSMNSQRLLYASNSLDGRTAVPCQGCQFGGLWASTDAAANWHHVNLCSTMSTPASDNVHSVIFSAGQPFVATDCGIWTTADPALANGWKALPALPNGISPGNTILAPSPNSSPVLFACLGGGSKVYRSNNLGQSWDSGVQLPGNCTGLASVPLQPDQLHPAASVAIYSDPNGPLEVAVINHDVGDYINLSFVLANQQAGSGRPGVWVVQRQITIGVGPGQSYDVFAADGYSFFVYQGNSRWSSALPLHSDTWWMAFPASYLGVVACPAYAANDGGVFANTPNSCSFDGWVGASSGLHVVYSNLLSGASNPDPYCAILNGGLPCSLLFIASADDDTFVKENAPLSGDYLWGKLNDILGDSGEVLYDPAVPDLALAARNATTHICISGTSVGEIGPAPTPGTPCYEISPPGLWQGAQDGWDQGYNVVLTMPNEAPSLSGDYLAIETQLHKYKPGTGCRATNSCSDDIIVRNVFAGAHLPIWSDISPLAHFGPGMVDSLQTSGGHSNTAIYVRTSTDTSLDYTGTPYGPGQIWSGQYQGGLTAAFPGVAKWELASGSGANALNQAFNVFVNPFDPSELYVTDLGPENSDNSTWGVKVSHNHGRSWDSLPQLKDIATNHGEFNFDCGNFPYGGRGYKDRDIFGNECSLEQIVFPRDHPELRFAILYPGGVAFSRDSGNDWMPLNVTNAQPSQQPVELPMSAFYDPFIHLYTLNTTSLYVALKGKGIKRVDGPFETLEDGALTYCPSPQSFRPASWTLTAKVNPLNTTVPLTYSQADVCFHGDVLFDSATVTSVQFQFFVNGQATEVFTHTLSESEEKTGVAVLSNRG